MKLKTTIIASALLSLTALSAHAAQELTPEKAAALKPFDRITITGRFNAINEAVDAVSAVQTNWVPIPSISRTATTATTAATGASPQTFIIKMRQK